MDGEDAAEGWTRCGSQKPAFRLLRDERLKSPTDLSIFKRASSRRCECLSARRVCWDEETLANNKMFLWKSRRHSFLVRSFRRAAQGEMSTIRNKQPRHDKSWRREQYGRESERREKSDRCGKMEIEEDWRERGGKKWAGRWKHFLFFFLLFPLSQPVSPSLKSSWMSFYSSFLLFFCFLD